MSTQETPRITLNFHGTLGTIIHGFSSHHHYKNTLLKNIFLSVYSSPRNSSQFVSYSILKLVTPISGLKPHGVVAWNLSLIFVIEFSIVNNFLSS